MAPPRTTLVLVHGAWGSPGMWTWVVEALGDAVGDVALADLPTMQRVDATFADDVDHVRALAGAGPVVLCGHSYGGAVITEAGAELPGLRRLVYLAAAMPAVGESMFDVSSRRPVGGAPLEYRDDGSVMMTEWFPDDGRYDVIARNRLLGFTPRPYAIAGAVTPVVAAAWERVPSTFAIATRDTVIHPDTQREMAARADEVVEIEGDHMPHVERPDVVAELLRVAVRSGG